jgi:hypothetical protein
VEKLIYLVWGDPGSTPADHQRILLDEVAPRLLALDPIQLWLQVDDEDADVPVPLPAPLALLALGLGGLRLVGRRRRSNAGRA